MNDGIFPDSLFCPWADNPLRSRADVENALKALVLPVEKYRSVDGARIRLDAAAAHFDQASADMEGFSRLLWGLAPAQVGGAAWIDWEPIARGLANGCDPEHPEYWGEPFDVSQRLVELAAIGFALRLVPDKLWKPLSQEQRRRVATYLLKGHACEYADNNWKFFRLLIGMGLRHVGVDYVDALDRRYVEELDTFYIDDGWYSDGAVRRADHYVPFAFHFYGLILGALGEGEWTGRYRERAGLVVRDIIRWFGDEGPAVCFGRSMTYRFAIAGFFGALALVGDETLSSGQLKGYYLRHLRWWAKQPFAARDGVLPVGYAYPNLIMSEPYNSAQSPYWALKAFLPLMLPADHPFWAAAEEEAPRHQDVSVQRHIGFLVANPGGDAVALSCGQQTGAANTFIRFGPEKYAKFAYSARYGFSVESDPLRFDTAVFDNMLGLSDDGVHFRVREGNETAKIAGDVLYAEWRPFADVSIRTWLYWEPDCHVRVHHIESPRALRTIEGGFAIPCEADLTADEAAARAVVTSSGNMSAVIDLGSSVARAGRCHLAAPNTSLVSPKSVVPQLTSELPAGVSILRIAVKAGTGVQVGQAVRPREVHDLEHLVRMKGVDVTLMRCRPY